MKNKSINYITDNSQYTSLTTYQAGVLQAAVNRSLQKHTDALLAPYGITKNHWLIIGTVLDAGPAGIRNSDLASRIDTTMAYLTNTINLLESRDILVRTSASTDNRAKLVTVHPAFVAKCSDIENSLRNGLRKVVYSRTSLKDFRTYMKVLHQLSDLK